MDNTLPHFKDSRERLLDVYGTCDSPHLRRSQDAMKRNHKPPSKGAKYLAPINEPIEITVALRSYKINISCLRHCVISLQATSTSRILLLPQLVLANPNQRLSIARRN